MLDCAVTGGLVIDGTGTKGRLADIGISRGRITEIGPPGRLAAAASRRIDAAGLVVAPGFVDLHTHYDAQVFWDPTLSPSPLHGVTTVIGGNCGFSLTPLEAPDADYLMRMLARVEGMPIEALAAGVPWDANTTADLIDRLQATLAPNFGFLAGHCALRRAVMHEDAGERPATEAELHAMREQLRDSLRAGALGFSSTWSPSHNDHRGRPVPSRAASAAELLTLCADTGAHPGTTLEFIPGLPPFDEATFRLLAGMSRAADRPLNWDVLQVTPDNADMVDHQLAGAEDAATWGGRVVALTLPDTLRLRLNFRTGFVLDMLPGWDRFMAQPPARRLTELGDPVRRAELDRLAQQARGPLRSRADWATYTVLETFSADTGRYAGRTIGDIAREQRQTPWDALAGIVVADELRTVIATPADLGQDDESWARRVALWRNPHCVVGGSDAGAHLDMIDSYSYCTTLLAEVVRRRGLLPLEEAVRYLTDVPARLYGLRHRGRIREGWWADLVVFDADTIAPRPPETRHDLPAGAARIHSGAVGIHHVLVGGAEVVRYTAFTDQRPGRVLRSGHDTDTVTVRSRVGSRPVPVPEASVAHRRCP